MIDPSVSIEVTGQVTLVAPDGSVTAVSGRQPQILLAMLALQGGEASVEAVADVLWGEELSAHWQGALRGVASKVRNVLNNVAASTDSLVVGDGTIRLQVSFVDNVSRAEALVAAAGHGILDAQQVDELRAIALQLSKPFLAHNDSAWADARRRHIDAVLDRAQHAVLRSLHRAGHVQQAIAWAEHVAARDPMDVITRETLIELHVAARDVRAARRVFDELVELMHTEFASAPDAAIAERVRVAESPPLDLIGVSTSHRHPDTSDPFVGRRGPLETIERAWRDVLHRRRPELILLRGPAGIGKTRLADRALDVIDPPQRLWGQTRPGTGHPWGPFADALADAFGNDPRLTHAATVAFPAISRLLPEFGARSRKPLDSHFAPRESVLAVTREIMGAVLQQPTVLVVDDLQWSSSDGLALLESVFADSSGPLLGIATHRGLSSDTAVTLESLARRIRVTEIDLGPFGLAELTELVHSFRPGADVADDVIVGLQHRSGGLPFFACALVRGGDRALTIVDEEVPESVTIWLESYLATLTEDQRRLLELVAVFGANADLQGIEVVSGRDPLLLADSLDQLATLGLVSIDTRGGVRIPHDLTLKAVWDLIGPARKATLHRLVGDHLDRSGAPRATVARQWSFAGAARHPQALSARLEAGDAALNQGAWLSAYEQFEAVRNAAAVPLTQVVASIGAGRALVQMRRHADARVALEAAIDLAAHHGFDCEMAEATLVLVGRAGRGAITDDDAAQLQRLRAAYDRLARREDLGDDVRAGMLLARLESELAIATMFTSPLGERHELVTRALERVRATPRATPTDLAGALLVQRFARIGPDGLKAQIAEADEVLALPHGLLDADTLVAACLYRHEDLLRLGRRLQAAFDLERATRVAGQAHHDYWHWAAKTWKALDHLLDGDVTIAERQFADAAQSRIDVAEVFACHQVNLVGLRLVQGRVMEMVPTLQVAADNYPEIPTWRAALALALAESGYVAEAAEQLSVFTEASFELLPKDTNRLFALGILAHVAATVRDTDAAAVLWNLLDPYRGQLVLLNVYGGAGACWGPLEWALARLATVLGRDEDEAASLWRLAISASAATPVLRERISREGAEAGLDISDVVLAGVELAGVELSSVTASADRTGRSASTS